MKNGRVLNQNTLAIITTILLSALTGQNASAGDCSATYQRAADRYYQHKNAGTLSGENCRTLMDEFQAVAETYPDCHKADDALYMIGILGVMANKDNGTDYDLKRAVRAFRKLAGDYPDSTLADDARYLEGEVHLLRGDNEKARQAFIATTEMRSGDMAAKARKKLAAMPEPPPEKPAEKPAPLKIETLPAGAEKPRGFAPGPMSEEDIVAERFGIGDKDDAAPMEECDQEDKKSPAASSDVNDKSGAKDNGVKMIGVPEPPGGYARLTSVRYWSNADYTRVVVDLDREVPYAPAHLLNPDPELGTPPRLYVDFQGAVISQDFKDHLDFEQGCYALPIGDGLLKKARAAQYQPGISRVVLDIERIDRYHAFALPGKPFRYVIDVYGTPAKTPRANLAKTTPVKNEKPAPPVKPIPAPTIKRKKTIVVLDAGHGGKDPGAVGPSGLKEKDITLSIARRAERIIEARRPDVDVVLTRTDDRYLGLVDRTAMANTLNADLFVSIHCNAAENSKARGIETYYLDNTTDSASLKLAAKENFVTEKVLAESQDTTNLILADLITSSKVEDSVPLAGAVQASLYAGLSRKWSDTYNKGVKKAPFWVLTGATMPCVLVEVGFISNKTDEKRFRSADYQQAAAEAIAAGVIKYLDDYPEVTMAK